MVLLMVVVLRLCKMPGQRRRAVEPELLRGSHEAAGCRLTAHIAGMLLHEAVIRRHGVAGRVMLPVHSQHPAWPDHLGALREASTRQQPVVLLQQRWEPWLRQAAARPNVHGMLVLQSHAGSYCASSWMCMPTAFPCPSPGKPRGLQEGFFQLAACIRQAPSLFSAG